MASIFSQTKLIYNFIFPIQNKIQDRHSSKTPNKGFYLLPVGKCVPIDNKGKHLVRPQVSQGNNIRVPSMLLLPVFDISIKIYFCN